MEQAAREHLGVWWSFYENYHLKTRWYFYKL